MGDISAEPSMEEILSSIKRIIAEEGEATAARPKRNRAGGAASRGERAEPVMQADEVLELRDAVPEPSQAYRAAPTDGDHEAEATPVEPILSPSAIDATRGPLEALSRMVVKPETPGSDTLEGLVREMLKPMLRDWLDANLPRVVETMVAREISRITGRQG